MKREVHETRTKRVWKTDEGRVLLIAAGGTFNVDAFECDGMELETLQIAIQEALLGWGNAPFTKVLDGVPQTEGRSNDAVSIQEVR